MSLWPHQTRSLAELRPLVEQGGISAVLAAPTGAGKTRIMREMLHWGFTASIYTHRRMLLSQTADTMREDGIDFAYLAAGHERDDGAPIQLCMIQTADSLAQRLGSWSLPNTDMALIDEAHADTGERMEKIISSYRDRGKTVIGFTATPLDISHLYDRLIVAATNGELRQCGAHIPAYTWAPSEIDQKMVRRVKVFEEEFVTPEYRQAVFGSVLEHYNRLNPDRRPAILFAPGVKESRWFAEHFRDAGVRAAHIDAERIWLDGEEMPATDENRAVLRQMSELGTIEIVCNRFVMREGIDFPWLEHLILACPFSSLGAYVQAGGRVLRAHPTHDRVIVQDHGGNWWRHGSLNSDREWRLDLTDEQMVRQRAEQMREGKKDGEKEPLVCPECGAIRNKGDRCHNCGRLSSRSCRMVIEQNGDLRPMHGDVFRPRKVSMDPADVKLWKNCFFQARNAGQTLSQARGNFLRQTGRVPNPEWPYVPKHEADWPRKAKAVPFDRLNRDEPKVEQTPAPSTGNLFRGGMP